MTRFFGMPRMQGGQRFILLMIQGGKLKTDITDRSLKEKHLTKVSMT